MIDSSAVRSEAAEAAAPQPEGTVRSDASQIKQPQSADAPDKGEMALSAGAADWIEAVQRIEHRDWSAILRVASDSFDGVIKKISHFVQTDGSMAAAADDAFQTASTAEHQAPAMRAGSTGLAWYMPPNMDALLAGVQIQSKMAPLDPGLSGKPMHGVIASGDAAVSAKPEAQFAPHAAPAADEKAAVLVAAVPMNSDDTAVAIPAIAPPASEPEPAVVVDAAEVTVPEGNSLVTVQHPDTLFDVETSVPAVETPVTVQHLDTSVDVETNVPAVETPVTVQHLDTSVDVEISVPAIAAPELETPPSVASDYVAAESEPVTSTESSPSDDSVVIDDVPAQPELPPHSDLFSFRPGSGHVYVTDFDKGVDHILVTSDRFSSFDGMLAHSAAYQDEGSTVIEFQNGTDFLVLTHFSIEQLSADMFTFEPLTAPGADIQQIHGTDGDDIIELGSGGSIVDPGAGFDVVTGGAGRDTFVFGVNSGRDFIVDFKPQDDHIQIDTALADSFDNLLDHAAIYQDGGSAQIEFSGGQLITLYNTDAAAVGADWFVFA
jgi:hypothetical protein